MGILNSSDYPDPNAVFVYDPLNGGKAFVPAAELGINYPQFMDPF
jgi:hypothetical protein